MKKLSTAFDGNDDGGTLSAWYVLSALRHYPVDGSDKDQLGVPLFEWAEVKLKNQSLGIMPLANKTEVAVVALRQPRMH